MKYTFENLITKFGEGLLIKEQPLPSGIRGLYADGVILINKALTDTEKACTLLEEIGHHKTSQGDILDQSIAENRKQETQARDWAASEAVSVHDIKACRDDPSIEYTYHAADKLQVTEEILVHAYNLYLRKEAFT